MPKPAGPRVLQICQPTTGGAAVCVRQLTEAGIAAGFPMAVACPSEGELAAWVRAAGAVHVPLPLRRRPEPADAGHVVRLHRWLRTADVVHLHSSKAGADARLALVTLPDRPGCVFTPHGWSWSVGGPMAPAYRAFERLVAPVADVIVAVSEEEAALGRTVLGSRANLVVVPNGVDPERFRPDGPLADRPAAPLVVCVGRLARAKGQDLAVRALTHLPGTVLRLVGDGPDRPAIEELARDLGVRDRVELVGAVSDPAPQMRAADVVVVPSRWEGLSLVQLEAMACGAAVVATRVPGTAILDGAGELVPPADPVALADGIGRLLSDPARRMRLGTEARRVVASRFTLAQSTGANLTLWRAVARPRRAIAPAPGPSRHRDGTQAP